MSRVSKAMANGTTTTPAMAAAAALPQMYARDELLNWYRGEFTAANAIIDSLCSHLTQISPTNGSEYEAAFAAIHHRRLNWFPLIYMQRFCSIADVAAELRRVAGNKMAAAAAEMEKMVVKIEKETNVEEEEEESRVVVVVADEQEEIEMEIVEENSSSAGSSDRKVSDGAGSQENQIACLEDVKLCSNHEECLTRPERIKISKGFVAREPVKGHMVNVVKGLKVYEDIFTDSELTKLADYINELRVAGRKGELSGETFIFFNKEMKGNKKEIIQLGVPLFQPTKEEATSNIEPIPSVLETVIDHLVQWRLIPEGRKPNSCIINFFDEDEYSQPYFKPPHLDNPISTLVLSETTMAFGRVLASDPNGNYKCSLMLPLKEGSLLVMRGNSADMARHVVCPSENKRVSITFVRVRSVNNQFEPNVTSPTKAMTLWQPAGMRPLKVAGDGAIGYGPNGMVPTWGMAVRAPIVMLPPPSRAMVMGSPGRRNGRGGTGVFLPWTVGPKRYVKHLPPRIQKRRLPSLPPPIEAM